VQHLQKDVQDLQKIIRNYQNLLLSISSYPHIWDNICTFASAKKNANVLQFSKK